MKKYVCSICGYIYDEAAGIPESGIVPGTKWEQLPATWVCPLCGAAKSNFKEQGGSAPEKPSGGMPLNETWETEELRELSIGELSALCSNLARGCEKQYLSEESALFTKLADYFRERTPMEEPGSIGYLSKLVKEDLETAIPHANAVSKEDRGALRALTWGEKVSRIVDSVLQKYLKEGDAVLKHMNIYVCDICGFVYIGDAPPALCPVCKVPSFKISKIERGLEA